MIIFMHSLKYRQCLILLVKISLVAGMMVLLNTISFSKWFLYHLLLVAVGCDCSRTDRDGSAAYPHCRSKVSPWAGHWNRRSDSGEAVQTTSLADHMAQNTGENYMLYSVSVITFMPQLPLGWGGGGGSFAMDYRFSIFNEFIFHSRLLNFIIAII